MPGSFTNLIYHIVFSTKNRDDLISIRFEDDLYQYIGGIIRGEKGKMIKIGGTTNHLHILTKLSPTISLSDFMRQLKTNSSKWINDDNKLDTLFSWQRGYGAFSVSVSALTSVSKYIESQKEHHKKISFQDEFLLLLKKHNVQYDEKYVLG